MIEKSRLEELIKQGATIYCADRDVQFPIPIFLNEEDLSHEESCVRDNISTEDLFETRKQAEWALKYQHIPRTEYLDLPMWEDIVGHKDDDIYKIGSFRTKNGNTYNLLFQKGALAMWNVRHMMSVWVDLANEKNYIKLCDLCVKLFKGESDD